MSESKRIQSLEGLRSIMIFLIVLSHMEFLKYCNFGNAYELYWHNPTIAVDYFFMLSGFGMMFSFLKHGGMSGTGGGRCTTDIAGLRQGKDTEIVSALRRHDAGDGADGIRAGMAAW